MSFKDFVVFSIGKFIPDYLYIQIRYLYRMGKFCNLRNPQTFNEKLQWLKFYDRKPIYTTMVDKYAVKQYVADKIGEEYVIPTLGVWDRFEDIDFDKLPNQFVLKCTHDSGSIVICRDKHTFNYEEAYRNLNRSLKRNYFYRGREWPYKNVPRRIIAEKYMGEFGDLNDYKFFCFEGKPKIIEVDFDRFINHKRNLYSIEWELLDLEIKYPCDKLRRIDHPKNLEQMLCVATILSSKIPHVRIDLYNISGKIYFGEFTFYHENGLGTFTPLEWERKIGDLIKLPSMIQENRNNK